MVRVGGGWDTLEHYLDKHDPCRCSSAGQCRGWGVGGVGGGNAGARTSAARPSRGTHPLSLQPTARPSPGRAPSPRSECHPAPAPELAAQPQGGSAGAPAQR